MKRVVIMVKDVIKSLIPPLAWTVLGKLTSGKQGLVIKGDFATFGDAHAFLRSHSLGDYSEGCIVESVATAIEAVRSGSAVFERDGFLFDEKDYNYPVLTSLLYCFAALGRGSRIDVLDFGGSLGSTYFQNREVLAGLDYAWSVVEQECFVTRGRGCVPEISFYYTIDEYLQSGKAKDVCLVSSVLQYLDDPLKWARRIFDVGFRYVLVDRTYFNPLKGTHIGIQYVASSIYNAQYPITLIEYEAFLQVARECGYSVVNEWVSPVDKMPLVAKGKRFVLPSRGVLLSHGDSLALSQR